jgi:malate dehydrogenase
MQTVAILGAGELGGAIARTLATADVARRVILVDKAGPVAAGKALDILQSGPVEGFHTRVTGASEPAQSGAAVVVLADEHGGGELAGDAALVLLRRTLEVSPRAVVIAAGATQLDTLEQARELGILSARLVGSAPLAAQSIACALTAMELDASAADLSMAIVGTPPGWVIAWADATLAGLPLTPLLAPPQTLRVEARLRARWPPGPQTLASAATAVVRAIDSGSHRRLTCFVARDGAYERRPFAALPVTLGASGVVSVHVPQLSARERVALGGD